MNREEKKKIESKYSFLWSKIGDKWALVKGSIVEYMIVNVTRNSMLLLDEISQEEMDYIIKKMIKNGVETYNSYDNLPSPEKRTHQTLEELKNTEEKYDFFWTTKKDDYAILTIKNDDFIEKQVSFIINLKKNTVLDFSFEDDEFAFSHIIWMMSGNGVRKYNQTNKLSSLKTQPVNELKDYKKRIRKLKWLRIRKKILNFFYVKARFVKNNNIKASNKTNKKHKNIKPKITKR